VHENPLPNPPHKGEGEYDHEGEGEFDHEGEGERRACPFCKATDTEVISLFGSQVMTMQCKCLACGSFYEASKY
jgi:hypothetical protein